MADQKNSSSNNRWNWEVTGFEPRKSSSSSTSPRSASVDFDDYRPGMPLFKRCSISAASALQHSELPKQAMAAKLQKLKEKVKVIGAWNLGICYVFLGKFGFFELISDGEK